MKVKVIFYVVKDARGNKSWDCASDYASTVTLYGEDKDGKFQQYDSYEGYHAYPWAEKHGFTLECIEKEVEL